MIRLLSLVLSLAALFALGCASSQVRFTQDEIKSYPIDIQEHIIKGEVSPGMTQSQVRYSWGAPSEVNIKSTSNGQPKEEWVYSSGMGMFKTRLTFTDGKLTSIVSSEPGKVK